MPGRPCVQGHNRSSPSARDPSTRKITFLCKIQQQQRQLTSIVNLPINVRSIAISVSVCMSVCPLAYLKNSMAKLNFLYMLIMAVARSSSDDTAIRYVLPVFWMTSRFHTMEPNGHNQRQRYVWTSLPGCTKMHHIRCFLFPCAEWAVPHVQRGTASLCKEGKFPPHTPIPFGVSASATPVKKS